MALKDLMKNRNLDIQHADKGNTVVTEYKGILNTEYWIQNESDA